MLELSITKKECMDCGDLGIEIRHIRYFIAACEYGAFRKASAALEVQESTISRNIRDLEDRLGASLFHRQVGGVKLTFAGEGFLRRARTVLQELNEAAQFVSDIGRVANGSVNIGIHSSLASGFLPELLKAYKCRHPEIHLNILDRNPSAHVTAVQKLDLDIAFINGTQEQANCESEALWQEKVFIALPCGHELSEKSKIEWIDLSHQRIIVDDEIYGANIRYCIIQKFFDLQLIPDIRIYKIGLHNLLSLVAMGHGLTLTWEAVAAASFPGILFRPIETELLTFSAVWSRNNDNPALRRFLSMARSMSDAFAS